MYPMAHRADAWLVDCRAIGDAELAGMRALLGPSEAARFGRFVRAERRRQFVVGRMLLRHAVAQLPGMLGQAMTVLERAGQAPLLELPGHAAPGFSLSHSGDWVACAVSASTALGLDIERIDATRDIDALAAQAFDADQLAWLAARPESTRLRDFYQLWSLQEARFKLNAPAAYETALEHPAFAAVLCSAQPLDQAPQWQMATLAR